ncbi:MAG: hypothetical protein ACRDSJ_10110 [Rubrobacteraceae bacterium]
MSGTLPTFLIIGAQKSATRWLRAHLGEHPEVFTADTELSFFNGQRFEQGLDWYRTQFEGWNGEPIVGEATPAYMMWREGIAGTAARIDESLPGVRLMALLRNPVDRTYSAFVHHMRRGRIPADADLLGRIRSIPPERDELSLITGGWYAESLAPYFERFGERLRVFLHDDVAENPERLYEQALEHVGASPGFLPTELRRVRYSGRTPKTSSYAEDGGGRRELRSGEREEIYAYFSSDVQRLEEMLGRDLRSWRPS